MTTKSQAAAEEIALLDTKIAELENHLEEVTTERDKLSQDVAELYSDLRAQSNYRDVMKEQGAREMAEIAVKQHLSGPGWSLNEYISEEDNLMKLWKESKAILKRW